MSQRIASELPTLPEPTAKTILKRWESLDNDIVFRLEHGIISERGFLIERTNLLCGTLKAALERLIKLEEK